jgi:hypothetical protein
MEAPPQGFAPATALDEVDVLTSAYFFFFAFAFFGAAALAFLAFFAISLLQNRTRHAPRSEICELSLTQILTPRFAS